MRIKPAEKESDINKGYLNKIVNALKDDFSKKGFSHIKLVKIGHDYDDAIAYCVHHNDELIDDDKPMAFSVDSFVGFILFDVEDEMLVSIDNLLEINAADLTNADEIVFRFEPERKRVTH